jgi:serine/threonine protein kinase
MIPSCNIFHKKYEKIKEIGKGSYGFVYEVQNKINKKIFACKETIINSKITNCIYDELIAYNIFDHKNIVKVFDIYCEKDKGNIHKCYIVMEKCDMSLSELLIKNKKKLSHEQKIHFLEQLIEVLLYMRSKGYVHNDLSLTNILVKNNQIKIVDFGFMYQRSVCQKYYHKITQYVQPPELIKGISDVCDCNKIDTWSLAQIFYAICYNDTLIGSESNDNYYLDLISNIGKPSISILKKYDIDKKYISLYYRLLLNSEYKKELVVDDKTLDSYLVKLIIFNKKEYKSINCLSEKTKENKFIKKLINWNVNTRPDILEVYHYYCKIFTKNIEKKYAIDKMEFIIDIHEYDIWDLMPHFSVHMYLFHEKNLFKIHLTNTVMNNIDDNFMANIKTMHIMSCLWKNRPSGSIKLKVLDNINYISKNYNYLSNIEKLENSFDRFYSFSEIITYHHNEFDTYLFSEPVIDVKNLSKLQYYFIKLLENKINNSDAWSLFVQNKINKIYEPYYKYLYYLFLSSPLLAGINDEYILSAIMLIILGYRDPSVKKKIDDHFLKINDILNWCVRKCEIMPKSLSLTNKKLTKPTITISGINIGKITPTVFIISYFLIWTLKKISNDQYTQCAKKFNIGKKFMKYVRDFFANV